MKPIDFTDQDAEILIKLLKYVFKKYRVDLSPGNKGILHLTSETQYEFSLDYFTPKHRADKISIHIREKETNVSLLRVNVDPSGFHSNADGTIVRGNRLLVFSNEEREQKDDGFTNVRAFDLPSDFTDLNHLDQVFLDFLGYINVKAEGKVTFPSISII